MDIESLIATARRHVGDFPLFDPQSEMGSAGGVAAALETAAGNIYTGICIDLCCGIGFCAEHAAVAAMLLHRETVIKRIVAVTAEGILPPCGRCREMIFQVDRRNLDTEVIMPGGATMTLAELLPHPWVDAK